MTDHSTSVLVPCSYIGFRSSPAVPCLLRPNGRPSQPLLSTYTLDQIVVTWNTIRQTSHVPA